MDQDIPRRTQGMRSAETRAKILDATIECLIELGYSATSTPEVCRRAGMSRGALLHHFPTKTELVVQAVTHLAERRAEDIRAQAPDDEAAVDDVGTMLELVWQAFEGPLFLASLELWMAARCDAELHAALQPAERKLGRGIRTLWADLDERLAARDEAGRVRFNALVGLTIHLARGMAVQRILKEDESSRRQLFELWKNMARSEMSRQ